MGVYTDKRNNRLFIQFRLHGETYKERLPKETTRKEAEKLELKIKSQILFEQHGIYAPRKDQTFEYFIRCEYLPFVEHNQPASLDRAINLCKAALPFFKGKQLRSIKPADIERFKQARSNTITQHLRQRKPATIARELSIISKIFSLAVQNDLCEYNPCSRVQMPRFDNVMNRVLSEQDEDAFFAAFDKDQGGWARDICKVVLHTGLRQNDVLGLQKFQVDLVNRKIRLTQGKTKRQLLVSINEVVYPILERRKAQMRGELIFPSPKTGKKALSVRTAIFNACRRAGIEKITIRDLRRTCATRLEEYGFSSATIARYLGHTDLRSVQRYQRSPKVLEDAATALANRGTDAPIKPVAELKKWK